LLQVLALVQIPEMQPPAILTAEQDFRHQTVLEGIRGAPFAGDHGVMAEMPPEIIGELLRSAIHLPLAEHIEAFRVEQEDAAGFFALRIAERVDVNAFRSAMDGVD